MANILIIDDDPALCETMERVVARAGHTGHSAGTLKQGVSRVANEVFDVVFLDVRLPDGNGLDALPDIIQSGDSPEVIILTGKGDPEGAEMAIEGGVVDYLVKPSSIQNTLGVLERALKYRQEKQEASRPALLNLGGVVGVSPRMRACFELLGRASSSNSNVLITGETGTGKELIARTIHANHRRSNEPFVVVDCAALTETLVESSLFGHKKGSFTGADRDYLGLVRMADKGTLFLDEVGEMSLTIQKVFLRVLQERRFRPVGDLREVTSDFRLIAATNRDLGVMVEDGRFRRDLYFRLKTIALELPPLRERGGDIKILSMYRLNALCEEYGLPAKGFDPAFFDMLMAYNWSGNVRELFSVLETAFIAAGDAKALHPMHLPRDVRIAVTKASLGTRVDASSSGKDDEPEASVVAPTSPNSSTEPASSEEEPESTATPTSARCICAVDAVNRHVALKPFKEEMERDYLRALLSSTNGDVDCMVDIADVSKSHLYALLKKNDLSMKGPW
ncbi:sigma-54-dependent transcriptional regulator [Desulfovibrio inopinatus]|uniref:sigma-54-dependent transcriptional regulator n=1 Tax=Desulfovibrio inopinatus TaxID=102109 RepID=UPI00040CAF9A|nr:sigma-54 dependent transcriptional regulator [Desulfovibrio inopinatus]